MEVTGSRIVTYRDKQAEFSLYNVADIHWGNRGCAKGLLKREIDQIKHDPYALFIGGGDYIDAIFPGDPRFDPEAIGDDILVKDLSHIAALLVDNLAQLFIPIVPRCLGWCYGNHELKYMTRTSQMFLHEEFCSDLSIPNMRYSGWMDIYFIHRPRQRYPMKMVVSMEPPESYDASLRVYINHGIGAATTAGGKINALKKLVDITYDADLVIMGHVHEQFAKAFTRLTPDATCTEIRERVTMGMISGSYLRTYGPDHTSYGEQRGYPPTTMGATRARYKPSEFTLIVENKANGVGRPK